MKKHFLILLSIITVSCSEYNSNVTKNQEDFGVGGLSTTFTQDLRTKSGRVRSGSMWTTKSVNLNLGSKTFVGGSTGVGMTWAW